MLLQSILHENIIERMSLNQTKLPTISILGCGWYGLPLGKNLFSLGYQVKGSTTSESKLQLLQTEGIKPFLVQIEDKNNPVCPPEFLDSDVLILNIPPKRRDDIEDYYFRQMQTLLSLVQNSKIKKIIFISSTSVYPDKNTQTDEVLDLFPDKPSGKALLKAEKLFLDCQKLDVLILRFAGLIGNDRNPGRFLAEKRDLKDGNAPVNLVHLDDCIAITLLCLQKECYGEIFNVCADEHPLRKDYYRKAALQLGLKPPEFLLEEKSTPYKIVSNDKLKKVLGYQYSHSINKGD